MIIQLFALSIVLVSGTECILQRQLCQNIQTKIQCDNTDNPFAKCEWNNTCKSRSYDSCYQFFTEQDCLRDNNKYRKFMCYWKGGECMKRVQNQDIYGERTKDLKCEDIDNYSECRDQRGEPLLCAWYHNHCQAIEKCSQINDFKQCRNARTRDRCQFVVNNVASDQEKENMYSTNIFDFTSCRSQDCQFNTHSDCPTFRNGRRCFLKKGKCTQCSYFTNPNDCIATNKCTWQNSQCSNIMCSQITSKRLCNQYNYCQYDFTTQRCQQSNQIPLSHCYTLDISSDPIQKKYNSFI
ncbi:unnamed protein product [Paramecium octaurelia]|uniref:Uncharacterized protein n=1 Tax=Paramecium octaurelia TaxID=43137 RepID=A0A8S1VZ88_PAROT|nr:unnamed protein product [Paramecium octaurelia]